MKRKIIIISSAILIAMLSFLVLFFCGVFEKEIYYGFRISKIYIDNLEINVDEKFNNEINISDYYLGDDIVDISIEYTISWELKNYNKNKEIETIHYQASPNIDMYIEGEYNGLVGLYIGSLELGEASIEEGKLFNTARFCYKNDFGFTFSKDNIKREWVFPIIFYIGEKEYTRMEKITIYY